MNEPQALVADGGPLLRKRRHHSKMPLPATVRGDTIAVLTTGAYNYSMASNYNRIGRPPVVLLSQGTSKVAVKRESLDDLIANDI